MNLSQLSPRVAIESEWKQASEQSKLKDVANTLYFEIAKIMNKLLKQRKKMDKQQQ